MILLAPHIASFLQQRLPMERRASPNTCDSYAYAFRLLFEYASDCIKLPPSQLQLEQLDAPLIVNFLNYLETKRGSAPPVPAGTPGVNGQAHFRSGGE